MVHPDLAELLYIRYLFRFPYFEDSDFFGSEGAQRADEASLLGFFHYIWSITFRSFW